MRKTKAASAYDAIKDLVLREKIEPGCILSTSALMEQVKMSRAPVVDAIKRLESEGFIKVMPQQGIMIREMTVHEMRDINEMRLVLETYVTEKVTSQISEEDISHLEDIIDEMKQKAREKDYYGFILLDHEMHNYLYDLHPNEHMKDTLRRMRDRIFAVGFKIVARRKGRMESTIEEHSEILEALRAKDATRAAEIMRLHLTNGWKLI